MKSQRSYSIIIITIILFTITIINYAQGWEWQNPLPFGDPVLDVFFVGDNYGWMAPQNTTLYKTTNGGNDWDIINTDILFEKLFFDDSLEGWGIGRKYIFHDYNSIYHTIDGGENWEIQLADTSVRYEIFFINKNIGWATGTPNFNGSIYDYSSLFKTTDGGLNWHRSAINQLRWEDTHKGVLFLDSLKGWLVGDSFYGVKTTDGGNTWVRDSSLGYIKKIFSIDSLHLWGLSDYDFIVRTTDGGEIWNEFKIIDTTAEVRANDIYATDKNNIYVSTNIGFFGSTNGGVNFSLISTEEMNSFVFIAPQEVWGGGEVVYSGIFHSTNKGQNWVNQVQINNEFGTDTYYAVDFVSENTGWMAGDKVPIGTGCFIIKTSNSGMDWQTQYNSQSGTFRDIMFLDEYTGWAVGGSGFILKTIDGGANWIIKNSGKNYSLNKIHITDYKHGWASGGNFNGGVIIKTTDSGENWIEVTPSINISSSYELFFLDSLTGWFSTGYGSGEGHLLKTTDGGENWLIQRQAFGMYFDALYAKNHQEMWAGGYDPQLNNVLIYSLDGGENWIGNSSFIRGAYDIKFADENNGWLISFREVYNTTDGGINWKQQKSYSTQVLKSIDFVNDQFGWIVGSWGTILHTDNGGVTNVEESSRYAFETVQYPTLYQNYPNPFNPDTRVTIYLPSAVKNTSIVIYNLLGQEIKELYNGFLTPGNYTFYWDGKDLEGREVSSGVYFSVFKATEQIFVKKMLKLK